MKRFLFALWLACVALPASAGDVDVGVSIEIGDPNFYGRIDIGDFPQPRVIYRKPVVVERVVVVEEPLYLRVPPGHAKSWRKHCRRYGACGRRVYFVQDDWYNDVYAPRYRERHRGKGRHDHDHHHDHGPGKGKKHKD
jgi:hypothetical protein